MSGYCGYSMSNNAVNAYDNGEKPFSKWTKTEIIEALSDYPIVEVLKKIPAKAVKQLCLVKTSWHHTSCKYNKTDFYSIDDWAVSQMSKATIDLFVNAHCDAVKSQNKRFKGTLEYLEWVGSKRHPRPIQKRLTGDIEDRGCFYYVYVDNVLMLKKKKDSNGTKLIVDKQ